MEMKVQNAVLKTHDNEALDTFWLTDYNGHKLDDFEACMVQERLADFINYCSPGADSTRSREDIQMHSGPVTLRNNTHPKLTEVLVYGGANDQGYLLQLASVMTGMGIQIEEAVIQSCSACNVEVDDPMYRHAQEGSRMFRFFVYTSKNEKLGYSQAAALLYTLQLLSGRGYQPLTPPGMAVNMMD